MHHHMDRITHTTAFGSPAVEHWLERQTAQSIRRLIAPRADVLPRYYYLGRKEGNVLFNDALNTFYVRLYGIGHMVVDH